MTEFFLQEVLNNYSCHLQVNTIFCLFRFYYYHGTKLSCTTVNTACAQVVYPQ